MAEAEYVEILVGHADQADIARKLLDAASDPEQVQTISVPPGFRVPKSVADAAGYSAEEGAVAVVDAKAVEGYALAQVTGVQTEGGARGIAEASNINRTAQPEAQAVSPESLAPTDNAPIGDTQVAAELERSGEPTERVDDQPPLGGAENVTTEGDGTHLHNNRITTTNYQSSGGGDELGQDPAEGNPPGTLTGSDVPTEPPTGGAPTARGLAEGGANGIGETGNADQKELTVEQALELKGDALDDALRARGLAHTTGTADEKRQRLADYLSA